MAGELLNELETICTQGAIEEWRKDRAFEGCLPYKVVGNREWNCAHFAEEGMPFSQSAVPSYPNKTFRRSHSNKINTLVMLI